MPRRSLEDPIHEAVLNYLRAVLPKAIVAHVPNGGKRDRRTASKMKKLGVVAGMPDLITVLPNGRVLFVEVKAPKGRAEDAQTAIWKRLRVLGHEIVIVRSVDEMRRALAILGIKTIEVAT